MSPTAFDSSLARSLLFRMLVMSRTSETLASPDHRLISLLLWIGTTEAVLLEIPGDIGHPVEHHYRRVNQSPIHKLKTYIEMLRHMERHRYCVLSGPGMDKHHFLTWLIGYGESHVKRIVSTEEQLSGTRQSLLDLRTHLNRRLGE
jgi:hypothetical protein